MRKEIAKKLGISQQHLGRIIFGSGNAGQKLSHRIAEEIGGTPSLWRTKDHDGNRIIVYYEYILKRIKDGQ